MQSFLSLAQQRQSDRAFDTTRAVEADKLDRILQAAQLSPSACNAQPWHIIVVDEPELKNRVADTTSSKLLNMNHFTKQAPVHLIIVEERVNLSSGFGGWVKDKNFSSIDIGVLAAHICLAAEDEGLGSCIIGWFDEKKIRRLLDIPDNRRVVLDVLIGYSTQGDRKKKRKELSQFVTRNSYKG